MQPPAHRVKAISKAPAPVDQKGTETDGATVLVLVGVYVQQGWVSDL